PARSTLHSARTPACPPPRGAGSARPGRAAGPASPSSSTLLLGWQGIALRPVPQEFERGSAWRRTPRTWPRALESRPAGRGPLPSSNRLPAAGLEELLLLHRGDVQAPHGLSQPAGNLRQDVGILEVGRGLHDGPGPDGRILGFE